MLFAETSNGGGRFIKSATVFMIFTNSWQIATRTGRFLVVLYDSENACAIVQNEY